MPLSNRFLSLLLLAGLLLLPVTLCHAEENEAEVEEGFVSLFNGEDLTGWTAKIRGHASGENFADTFRVVDGVIQVNYDKYEEPFNARFGHLFCDTEFSSYILRLEYRFTGDQLEGGPGWAFRNSGIMCHGQSPESMSKDQDFPVSIEVQLLGGSGSGNRTTANMCSPGTNIVRDGEVFSRHCWSSESETYHGDQWVNVEVEFHGSGEIIHRVEGEVVMQYSGAQYTPGHAAAAPLIEAAGGELLISDGTISLQSESHPCEFRNIRIKVLEE